MKKLYSLIAILSLASLVMAQDYQLVWNEDFTEESLDRNVWNVETTNNGGGNNELQYYCEKGVSLGVELYIGTRELEEQDVLYVWSYRSAHQVPEHGERSVAGLLADGQ